MSVLQEADHLKNTVVLNFPHVQCLHLMYFEVAWALAFSKTQVQLQMILDPNHLSDYLFISYNYVVGKVRMGE